MSILSELLSLNEMAKRASPDQFYKFAKDMHGADKVKSLTWPEIVAVAEKHDVLIPAYLRSQKVGRGRFNLVPADHADVKTPAKIEPKADTAKARVNPQMMNMSYSDYREFTAALKKEHGADIKIKREDKGPYKSGRFGIREGESWVVDENTDKIIGIWETTGADKLPGRGLVTYGYGYVAKAKQEQPKVDAPKTRRKGGEATDAELKAAISDVYDAFTMTHIDASDDISKHGNRYEFGIRGWGRWEGDDGSGDYDHQDLSRESAQKAGATLERLEARHKNVKLSFSTGEKNWMYFVAE